MFTRRFFVMGLTEACLYKSSGLRNPEIDKKSILVSTLRYLVSILYDDRTLTKAERAEIGAGIQLVSAELLKEGVLRTSEKPDALDRACSHWLHLSLRSNGRAVIIA